MKDKFISDEFNEKVELSKVLSEVKPEFHDEIYTLFNKRNRIKLKNGFFANLQLNQIYKKIEKIKTLSKNK